MIKHLVAAAAALAMSMSAIAGTSSFDSGAEFSSTQGAGGWTYGYYSIAGDASSFTQFSYFDATSSPQWWEEAQTQAPWTLLWDTGGHPNYSGTDHWAVRRWTSGTAGDLSLGIQFQAEDAGTTNVHVIVDGAEIYANNTTSTLQTWSTTSWMTVAAGSHVDFAIDANGLDNGDSTRFTAQGLVVTPVPEPETYAMMLAGIGMLSAAASRRKKKSA